MTASAGCSSANSAGPRSARTRTPWRTAPRPDQHGGDHDLEHPTSATPPIRVTAVTFAARTWHGVSPPGGTENRPVEPAPVTLAKGCHRLWRPSSCPHAALSTAREALRTGAPLVHCLTNTVVQTITANALLAVGAAPAMVDAPEEAGDFAAIASAVLVNVGTVHARTAEAMRLAARSAGAAGPPVGARPGRRRRAGLPHRARPRAGELRPTVVRGNASEVLALAGAGAGGAASTAPRVRRRRPRPRPTSPAGPAAWWRSAARSTSSPTGPRTVRVGGGSDLLTRTTGAGCALGAVVAAYLAVTGDPLTAAVAAHAHVALAAEVAADLADGPGTFAVQWLDALDALDGDALARADLRS